MRKASIAIVMALLLSLALVATASAVMPGKACDQTAGNSGINKANAAGGNVDCTP